MLAAHADAIRLDPALFARIARRARAARHAAAWTTSRSTWSSATTWSSSLAGAGLDRRRTRPRCATTTSELSTLSTRFEKNLLADTNDLAVLIEDAAELDGLSAGEISAAAAAATERGLRRQVPDHPRAAHRRTRTWPACSNRELRERLFEASVARGSRGGEHDNRGWCCEIVAAARRTRAAARLRHPRRVRDRRRDGEDRRGRRRDARPRWPRPPRATPGPRGRAAEADRRSQVRAATGRRRPRRLGLGVLHRAGPPATYDVDTAALRPYFELERVLQRRRLLRGRAALRLDLRRAPRPGRLPPRRPGVGGLRRRTAPPSACTSATSTPARASAAGPG